MTAQAPGGIKRIIKATGYSWRGFKAACIHEAAFRQELLLAVIAMPLGFYLGKSGVEKALLVSSVLIILIVELLNSGIETLTDRVGTERHELSGRAKDIGSCAVLLSFVYAAIVWGLVLFG